VLKLKFYSVALMFVTQRKVSSNISSKTYSQKTARHDLQTFHGRGCRRIHVNFPNANQMESGGEGAISWKSVPCNDVCLTQLNQYAWESKTDRFVLYKLNQSRNRSVFL